IKKGKITGYYIDSIQSTRKEIIKEEITTYESKWNEKSKKELGYYYGMHAPQAGTMPVTAENLETYKAYLEEENKLEWFEQVAIITDDVIKNGKDSKVDKTAGVTIITDNYYQLIAKLFAYKK
ncbi:MAG: hypothetical protein M0O92_01320, partial [Acholeplasmataceae bacterium]|nr:hypothetical protein [Acholeplasmataceae bacterium]